ncbi:Uu.00g127920.m01.CDS01 [Anthostomella pinea]|uniref:Uu.00g127920.m01.CDS01 n=1 Tax=Anthostomella pinea TaxID=933095 RepID=A0AAI8YFI4_9PEZI|nr:Uu.00g127920.m01.CDS01 [Anthostomella pinea]
MFTNVLLSVAALASQALAAPTLEQASQLITRQGYVSTCTSTYNVLSGDACFVIIDKFHSQFSLADFYSWNPEVDSNCSNLFPGETVCVGVNGTATPLPACPSPVKPGLVTDCDDCYTVVDGDTCGAIATTNDITLAEFYSWNPDLDNECLTLEVDYNYCVGVSA